METGGNELFNSKNKTLNAANHQHHGKPVRVRTIEFLCKLYDLFCPRMVLQTFQKRLYPLKQNDFPETLADFANSLVTITNSLLLRFIAYILGAQVMTDRLLLLHAFNAISSRLCAHSNCSSTKSKNYFSHIFSCKVDLTMRRRLYFDDREMKWIREIKWIFKMK